MEAVNYRLEEHVAVLTLCSGENRFNPDFIHAVLDVMDDIEKNTPATVLMVRSAHEKIFCNGIDLEWLVPMIRGGDVKAAKGFFYLLNRLFKRTLTCPMVTLACMNGHVFAGGAIWSCAFDFRFMRSDRGYFCLPEVDLGIPFLPGMLALLKKAIPLYKLEEMHHSGMRLTAEACAEHHIVTRACHADHLEAEALAYARTFNKRREILKEMKARLYEDIVQALDVRDVPFIESGTFHIG